MNVIGVDGWVTYSKIAIPITQGFQSAMTLRRQQGTRHAIGQQERARVLGRIKRGVETSKVKFIFKGLDFDTRILARTFLQ